MKKNSHILYALLFAIAILVVLPSLYVSIRSSDPEFCLSCHYEKPYYDSWRGSSHSQTACIECHPNLRYRMPWLTFRYMVGFYDMKPHASVKTETCLKCHDKKKLFQEKLKLVDKKSFNHKQHLSGPLRGIQMRCSSCHSHIVQGNHNVVEETVCFTCHFMGASPSDSITGCTACHGTPKETVTRHGFSFNHNKYLKLGVSCGECHVKITEGTGKLVDGACHSCHVEPQEKPSNEAIHTIHVSGQGIDCFECHGNIRHGNLKMVKTFDTSCKNCHENLHSAQKSLYMGVGGKGLGDYPSRMFAAQVTCRGCHTKSVKKKRAFVAESTRMPAPAACVACHQPGYDSMLKDWQHSFKFMLNYVGKRIHTAETAKRSENKKKIIGEAHHNFGLVKGGHPAHNVEYSVKLLKFTLDEVDKISPKPVSDRPKALRTSDGYCATLCHNRLGMPENLLFQGKVDFPHQDHIRTLGTSCGRCHSVEQHGLTKLTLAQCNTCHHQELKNEEGRCANCHGTENQLFNGKLSGFEAGDPNPMLRQVSCTDCHDVTDGSVVTVEAVRAACLNCHEKEYGDMLDEWLETGISHRNDLEKRIAELQTASDNKQKISRKDAKLVERRFRRIRKVESYFKSMAYIHNPDYAETLYESAVEDYDVIREKIK
ncbi:MAG: hypothetical protein DRJ08_06435 [Acidobacteria bacterium]|nr:MAG: hypothetical protein DRJ08_06435 [Acidobacteriota bacterium]